MAVDLSKMSDKELAKLQTDIVKETQRRAKSKIEDARKAAEAAAKKHGFSLNGAGRSAPHRRRNTRTPTIRARPGADGGGSLPGTSRRSSRVKRRKAWRSENVPRSLGPTRTGGGLG